MVSTFPVPDTRRDELKTVLSSPVVQQKLRDILFRDDCSMVLWYFRTAASSPFEPGEAVALAQLGEELFRVRAPPGAEQDEGEGAGAGAGAEEEEVPGLREALALFDSAAVRQAVIAQLEASYLGARRDLQPGVASPLTSKRPVVDLAVMAGCPYGILAEGALAPLISHFGDSIDFNLRFILYDYPPSEVPAQYCAAAVKPAAFNRSAGDMFAVEGFEAGVTQNACSMHGTAEANEDLRQLAIVELHGMAGWWSYVAALNGLRCKPSDLDSCAPVAAANASLNYSEITRHAALQHGHYVDSSLAWLRERGGKLGSPSLFANGALAATGALSTLTYARRICRFFDEGQAPEVCAAHSLEALEASAPPLPRVAQGEPAPSCLQPEVGNARARQPRRAHDMGIHVVEWGHGVASRAGALYAARGAAPLLTSALLGGALVALLLAAAAAGRGRSSRRGTGGPAAVSQPQSADGRAAAHLPLV